MRRRHTTKYAGIRYRLQDESRPDGPRRYIVGYTDANGQYHTETLLLGMTLEDARLRQNAFMSKRRTHIPTKMTVGELLNFYLGQHHSSLKPKTVQDYEYGVAVIKKYMEHRKLKELSPNDTANMIRRLQDKGLKTWTIKKILTPLVGSLKVAVREGWIQSNPLDALLPHERPKSDQREMRCLSSDEIPRLLEGANSERWRTLFATLIFTGLRISEALALTWDDVNGSIRVKEGKTQAAQREIMLIPALSGLLRAWKLRQAPGHHFVFSSAQGTPVSRREALRALRAAEKRAKLPEYTLHELRHTFASILIAQGETVSLVAHQMGHADPGVTLKVYAHLFDAQENVQLARDRLQAAFGGVV